MITVADVELLAALLQRAGVNPYEAFWANAKMDKLRAEAARAELEAQKKEEGDD